jgi:PAS domain-containing protein
MVEIIELMSPQQPIEMILLRQLASYLTIAIWMMDRDGNLVYYNEPAERLLGVTFDDAGPIHSDQLSDLFRVTDLEGNPLPDTGLPIIQVLNKQHPEHGRVRFCGMDGVWRDVEIAAMPIEGQASRFLGVFATFWEFSE